MDDTDVLSVHKLRNFAKVMLLLLVLAWTWFPSGVVAFWCLSVAYPMKILNSFKRRFLKIVLEEPYRQRTALISGAHRPEALHLARVLKKEGFRVIAVSPRCFITTLSFYSICVDTLIEVANPRTDPRQYVRQLIRICSDYEVDLFVPVSGPKEAQAEARAADSLSHMGVVTLAPPIDRIDYFVRLDHFYELVESMNMETVMYYRAHDMDKIAGLYRRGVIVINGCRFMAKLATPNGLHESKWLPMPRNLVDAQRKYGSVIQGGPWVVAKFTSGLQYVLTVIVQNNRVLTCLACREGQVQRLVRCREMEQWALMFFRRLSFDISGAFTIRFLKTVPEGRRTTFLPVFCKPCPHLSLLFIDGKMGLFSRILSGDILPEEREPIVDIVNHAQRPMCVYSIYQQLMELLYLAMRLKIFKLASEMGRTLRFVLRGREVVFRLCDPLPALLWYFVLLPCRIVTGLLLHGTSVGQMQFLNGQLRGYHHMSECFADEPGRADDDVY